jgi:putative phage-type endonuclease
MIHELEELTDIMDTLVFEDFPTIFTEDYANEFAETAMKLMYDYVEEDREYLNFHEDLLEDMKDIFYTQFEDHILSFYGEDIEEDMNELLKDVYNLFIISFYPERNIVQQKIEMKEINHLEDSKSIEEKINKLKAIPQPVQRTPEWYQFRHNLITASNAYKAFESQSAINQLIYEKCQPIKVENTEETEVKMVNTNTPLHWGQKYEPLSVLLYEETNKTKVDDFGCIQHPKYSFIGASPDGIIVDKTSDKFGRMLEIKNVVSREITGIPKKEYWVQMQLQMEVCDLDECDFLETKFVEYPDSNTYVQDTQKREDGNTTIAMDGKRKGIIIYFHTKEGKPFYVYKPLELKCEQEILVWEEKTLSTYQSEEYNYIFLKYIYWKAEVVSCVLVLRDRAWFQRSIQQLEKVWKTIEEERITGYEHRAPNRKPKREKPIEEIKSTGCLLKITKLL